MLGLDERTPALGFKVKGKRTHKNSVIKISTILIFFKIKIKSTGNKI
jgi:hypothetical protein